ncbi:MAG TPA: response regulator [Pyrinomonadaceae bacterium]|nr:response regulator [Pyrinomonadaceae bacterium]
MADDDPAVLRLVKTVIEAEGFTVAAANNGREAYRILKDGNSLVAAVVDVNMPYIQGTELVKFMQADERFRRIPVIVMTGEHNPKLPLASLAAGAVAFLPKPFSNAQLRTMLRTFTN